MSFVLKIKFCPESIYPENSVQICLVSTNVWVTLHKNGQTNSQDHVNVSIVESNKQWPWWERASQWSECITSVTHTALLSFIFTHRHTATVCTSPAVITSPIHHTWLSQHGHHNPGYCFQFPFYLPTFPQLLPVHRTSKDCCRQKPLTLNMFYYFLQCFDTVGWSAGRVSIKKNYVIDAGGGNLTGARLRRFMS